MLEFVDITIEKPFQDRDGIPFFTFGLQKAFEYKPLDFSYLSSEAVSTFTANKLNSLGDIVETIDLSTSLIVGNGVSHTCTGLVDYASDLDSGIYYFLVNDRYQSDSFCVADELTEGVLNQDPIAISGLAFYNTDYTISWREKAGAPYICFGSQLAENSYPLPFRYKATDAVSTFKLIEINTYGVIINETSLSTSLITSDGAYHTCTGLVEFSTAYIETGLYYFEVNGQYESELFQMMELENVGGIGFDIIGDTLIVY